MNVTETHDPAGLWGKSEMAYSRAVAQCLAFSPEFRRRCLAKIAKLLTDAQPNALADHLSDLIQSPGTPRVMTEVDLKGQGRVDIVVKLESGCSIVVENKKWAYLQPEQLSRYARFFDGTGHQYVLVLLAPSSYRVLDESQIPPGNFVRLTYAHLSEICLATIAHAEAGVGAFEITFLRALAVYFEELEHMPLTDAELDALRRVDLVKEAQRKIREAIVRVCEKPETSFGNYILGSRTTNGLSVYAGVRYGLGWYHSRAPHGSLPEAVAFVKDTTLDMARGDALFRVLERAIPAHPWDTLGDCDVKALRRDEGNEVRLVVARTLPDPELSKVEDLARWFEDALNWIDQVTNGWAAAVDAELQLQVSLDAS